MQLFVPLPNFFPLYLCILHVLGVKELPPHPQLLYFNFLICLAAAAIAAVLLVDINVL